MTASSETLYNTDFEHAIARNKRYTTVVAAMAGVVVLLAREGRAHYQELAHEDSEGRQSRDRHHADNERPAQERLARREPADLGDLLRAFELGDMVKILKPLCSLHLRPSQQVHCFSALSVHRGYDATTNEIGGLLQRVG